MLLAVKEVAEMCIEQLYDMRHVPLVLGFKPSLPSGLLTFLPLLSHKAFIIHIMQSSKAVGSGFSHELSIEWFVVFFVCLFFNF